CARVAGRNRRHLGRQGTAGRPVRRSFLLRERVKARGAPMKANPVGWFEIYVQDMNRAKRFYETVFQGKLEKLDSPGIEIWAFPMERNAAGCPGALVRIEGVPSGG